MTNLNNKLNNKILLSKNQNVNSIYSLQICYIADLSEWIYHIWDNDELIKSQTVIEATEPHEYYTFTVKGLKSTGIVLSIKAALKNLNIEISTENIADTFYNCIDDLMNMTEVNEDGKPYEINQLAYLDKDSEFYKNEIEPLMNKIKEHNIGQSYSEIEEEIIKKLENHKQPSAKLLADFITLSNDFYIHYSTLKRYIKTDIGFEEFTSQNIAEYFNDMFGENQISLKLCENTIDFITAPIEKDYNLIIFKNGTLNTDTEEFNENEYNTDVLPKLKTDLTYHPNAENEFKKTDLYSDIKEILYYPKWDWNEDVFFKMVGYSLMATNEKEKLITIMGAPNSRKTTLLTILKRIFNYSEVKLQTIAENERFQLIDCIDKDINIDDDIQGFRIEEIGVLNSFVSGAGVRVELKGKNQIVNLTSETTPILWNAGNKLPSVKGDGFRRRIVVIKAINDLKSDEVVESYKKNILNGKRDDEISLLISYSYQLYSQSRDSPVVNEETQDIFLDEWEWKSYPAKKAAEIIFMDSSEYKEILESRNDVDINSITENRWNISYSEFIDNGESGKTEKTYVTVKDANKLFKEFFKEAVKMGLIVKEQAKPNVRTFKSGMEAAGFYQIRHHTTNENRDRTTEMVYDDCIINPKWLEKLDKLKK